MGGPSEREYKSKLDKIREKTAQRAGDVRNDFSKIEKMKVNALKRAEEMRRRADHDIDKIEKDVVKSNDLAPESKERLRIEMEALRSEVEEIYANLRTRISETMIPAIQETLNIQ